METERENLIKKEFSAERLKILSRGFGGCISDGTGYDLDDGRLQVFVKQNKDDEAGVMFNGEYAGLKKIIETDTVRVPHPMKVLSHRGTNEWLLVMEYMELKSLNKFMKQMGLDLARLHLHNLSLESRDHSSVHAKHGFTYQSSFGFECATCCGLIPMCNEWESDWISFYSKHRLKAQVDILTQKSGDRQVIEYWSKLEHKLPSFFEGIVVKPSLLHGDLWSGNAMEIESGPVVFDPAAFYGHSEFDLAIAHMFGGFTKDFFDSYHSVIPKSPGFETRQNLYLLFHYLNHWNHFGSSYRHQTMEIMKKLV